MVSHPSRDVMNVEPISVLINNYFYYGIFPDEWKLARVVPLFKSGDS